ncbi:MAG: glycosyltransferase family 1 protein [Chloroflexota bacterium]
MRIGIDYTSAATQRAGIGRFTKELVGALLEMDRESRYLLVKPSDGEVCLPPRENLSVYTLPFNERLGTILWHRLGLPLPIDFLTGRLDIYHSPDFVLPPLRHGKTLLTIHDLSFLIHPECAHPKLAEYMSRAVPRSLRRATLVHANSENTKKDLIELLNIAPEKIEVVHEGVTPRFTRVTDGTALGQMRAKYGLEQPFILSVGTLEPRKNHGRLIQAHSMLKKRGLPHSLIIAGGKGWLYDETLSLPAKLGLAESVRFLGFVPDDELPALISLADAFVYPSIYEGFGLPPLEAMACGTPVVASNTSSLPEVLGDAAVLVDPKNTLSLAEAICRTITDDALRLEMRKRGLSQAARFTWRATAEKILDIYRRLGSEDTRTCE